MAAAGPPGCRPVVLGSIQPNLRNVVFEDGWQASAWHREREREAARGILGCCTPMSQCPAPQQRTLITKHDSHTPLETHQAQNSIKDSSAGTPQQAAATHRFSWGHVSRDWGVRWHEEGSGGGMEKAAHVEGGRTAWVACQDSAWAGSMLRL